jgi:hypothetical protein
LRPDLSRAQLKANCLARLIAAATNACSFAKAA